MTVIHLSHLEFIAIMSMAALNEYSYIFIHEWVDCIWLVLAPLAVHKGQRLKAFGFALLCVLTLRLQVEMVESTGFKNGFTGFWQTPLLTRGFMSYGIFMALYLLLSYWSPYTRGVIYLAASISIFFMAFVVSSIALII